MIVINPAIEQLKQKITKIKDTATERSYYPLLCAFLENYAKNNLKFHDPCATSEETSTQHDKHIGFPDITMRNGNDLIGWIEVKSPNENLNAEKFQEQFTRYKDSLENIVFTNLREWQLWQWVKEEGENKIDVKKTAELIFDLTNIDGANSGEFENFLIKFFEGRAHQTRTPKQLALALAKKTRLLSKQVEEALEQNEEKSDLLKLKETFGKTLIQDISDHQFSNMVAETMAYSLFLAALEHSHRDNGTELTLTNAIDYLPTNVPILADLYSLIKKVAGTIPNIFEATRLLVDQLNVSEIKRIHQKLVEHKPGEDPVIQFYEPFLKEYDPKEREARGVYYTPKPVVDHIVKGVDWILRDKFSKKNGLADESVHLLDPATGTGTFLMSAIQEIYGNIKKENKTLGEEMVKREFNRVVLNHILKHFYGFELLIAPFAIAHLKLTLEIERLGFDFELTRKNKEPDNDRFKVYLANTLDDPEKPPQSFFGFDSIPQESESARRVKKNERILVVLGNPPYSKSSTNQGEWIENLMEDYKTTVRSNETQIQALSDDYVKFMRFAHWRIDQTGSGIVALITNNGYLDGPLFRDMRCALMRSFEEIWIINLHGDTRKREIPPNGIKDKNIFDIQQGVSIIFMVRCRRKTNSTKVSYADLWGAREFKYEYLSSNDFEKIDWLKLDPEAPDYLFIPVCKDMKKEWQKGYHLYDLFGTGNRKKDNHFRYGAGFVTQQDKFAIAHTSEILYSNVAELLAPDSTEANLRRKYNLCSTNQWSFRRACEELPKLDLRSVTRRCAYRPFDDRYTIYNRNVCTILRERIMQQMTMPNLALLTTRRITRLPFNNIFITNKAVEYKIASHDRNTIVFPLYFYNLERNNQKDMFSEVKRTSNISPKFSSEFEKKLGFTFVVDGLGDLRKNFGPEAIFYYAYAIFHSPEYRSRYGEQLKQDFPYLPLTSNWELFVKLVISGKELVNLHLLGDNPFDQSKTIFDNHLKWGIKIESINLKSLDEWKILEIRYEKKENRIYVNNQQYFEGILEGVWQFMIGGYQICEKWLKDRKKTERALSTDDLKHYMKVVVAIRETIRVMAEIDTVIDSHGGWPKAFSE